MNRTGFIKKQFGHENPEGENNRHNDSSSGDTDDTLAEEHLSSGNSVCYRIFYNPVSFAVFIENRSGQHSHQREKHRTRYKDGIRKRGCMVLCFNNRNT